MIELVPSKVILTTIASLVFPFLVGLTIQETSAQSFKSQQKKNPRVRTAYAEKEAAIKALFRQKGLPYPPQELFIRVFKQERTVELWVGQAKGNKLELLKEYPICAVSGQLGPKRRQGDEQIPEGFYFVERFNPRSNFYLSLGINYPNKSDKILGVKRNLGGDIFLHGDCVTIGCVPITDDGIKEVYLIAVEARAAEQTAIPVHIFPRRLDSRGMKQLEKAFADRPGLLDFWRNLKEGFDFFEKHRRLPRIRVTRDGRYTIEK
jgi:murein L,D-transpeptidase YafK